MELLKILDGTVPLNENEALVKFFYTVNGLCKIQSVSTHWTVIIARSNRYFPIDIVYVFPFEMNFDYFD